MLYGGILFSRINVFLFISLMNFILPINSFASQMHSSTIVIAEKFGVVGVIKKETKSLSLLDISDLSVIQHFSLDDAPTSVAYDESVEAFYVASSSNSSLLVISARTFKKIAILQLDRTPAAILTTEDYLIVSNSIFGTVSLYDKYNLTLLKRLEIGGQPRGISYLKEGGIVYIADIIDGSLTVISLENLTITKKISTGKSATLTESVIFDLKTNRAYVPQTFKNNNNKSLQFDTTVFPSLSIIDLSTNSNIRKERIGIDVVDKPVGIPLSGTIYDNHLYLVNYASNDLTILTLDTLTLAAHLELGFTPFGLVVDKINSRVIINNTLDETISVVDSNDLVVIEHIKIVDMNEDNSLLNGERLFNNSDDIRLTKDQWISCATCHFEGGNDKSSWFFPDGKRSTPSLFNLTNTTPFHWNGDLDEVQDVEFTIQGLMSGLGLSGGLPNCDPNCISGEINRGRSKDLDDLAGYVKSLRFPVHFTTQNSLVNKEVYDRGHNIFNSEKTGCIKCHIPPHYMDNDNHAVNLAIGSGDFAKINTPSLLGLRGSPPYLHDGSAMNLRQVLERTNVTSDHGDISHLSNTEIDDLLIFLDNIEIPSESAKTLNLIEEYNEININSKKQISTAEIKFNISLKEKIRNLKLFVNISANFASDIYLVLHDLGTNNYFMLNKNLELGSVNTPHIYKSSENSINLVTKNIYNLTFDPLSVRRLRLHFYTIIVEKGKSIYREENWINFDKVLLEF